MLTGKVSLYFCDKILPSKCQDCFHNSFESLLLRCVERSQEISSLNQTLAWSFCCLLSPRTETNPTGFDFGWKCINTHSVWDTLNGRQEEDDDFTTGSKKVKCLQMWTLNQMGLALNLDTLLLHGYVTMGKGSYLSELQYPCYKIWIKISLFFINV